MPKFQLCCYEDGVSRAQSALLKVDVRLIGLNTAQRDLLVLRDLGKHGSHPHIESVVEQNYAAPGALEDATVHKSICTLDSQFVVAEIELQYAQNDGPKRGSEPSSNSQERRNRGVHRRECVCVRRNPTCARALLNPMVAATRMASVGPSSWPCKLALV